MLMYIQEREPMKIKTLIIPSVLLFLLLSVKFPFETAGLFLVIILGLISLKIFIKKAKNEYILKGIRSVPHEFVFNNETLSNSHCIVRNFPGRKIVVMDNPLSSEKQTLRAFVIDKTNHESIANCWNDICSVYDGYSSLDNLFSFIDKASGRLNIMFLSQAEGRFAVEGMEDFLPKQEKSPEILPKQESLTAQKIEQSAKKGQIIVEFEDLHTQNVIPEKKKADDKSVVNMQDLANSDKIDVNLANAQTISELPGINIVIAKKIVEYRNINGFFKSKEEFINISEVKEHFKKKILSMITVEKSSAVALSKELEAEKERTVD